MSEEKYSEPSNVANAFLDFNSYMIEMLEGLPLGKSFAVDKNICSLQYLRIYLENTQPGIINGNCVAIEHPTCYEVQCLGNCINVDLFYEFLDDNANNIVLSNEQIVYVNNIIIQYLKANIEYVNKYDKAITQEMLSNRIISWSYLQRKAGSLSEFKNDPDGATKALKKVVAELIKTNYLEKVEISGRKNFYKIKG